MDSFQVIIILNKLKVISCNYLYTDKNCSLMFSIFNINLRLNNFK